MANTQATDNRGCASEVGTVLSADSSFKPVLVKDVLVKDILVGDVLIEKEKTFTTLVLDRKKPGGMQISKNNVDYFRV